MNNITINWSAEDRARIDKLITLLEDMPKHDCSKCVDAAAKYATRMATEVQPAAPAEPIEQPEPNKAPEEVPAPIEETPAASIEPTITSADLQKKVVELSAAGNKDAVKEIVQSYAPRVSAIPEDKLQEVWNARCALEG
jgi:hypothetical protein